VGAATSWLLMQINEISEPNARVTVGATMAGLHSVMYVLCRLGPCNIISVNIEIIVINAGWHKVTQREFLMPWVDD
jgi:tRNA A-37 threonylcarbamoyl transferase component Bud32